MLTGRIFDLQRFAIHDGPGIRTTIFLKGCPLRCLWCSNPESIAPEPLLSYSPERCVGCGACHPVCPPRALAPGPDGRAILDRTRCDHCGECPPHCDPKALEIVGRDLPVDEILEIALRDRRYYESSGGGITLSGGEPLFQPEFATALLREARARDLHCCMETSGYAEWPILERMIPLVDLWLYDVKEFDPARHVEFTGVSNTGILANLKRLHDAGAPILLRCPMIPGQNARPDHLDAIAALAASLPRIRAVELLPYFDLWRAKLPRMGLVTRLPDSVRPPDRATIQAWNEHLRARGVPLTAAR